jgi:hypothetical protein
MSIAESMEKILKLLELKKYASAHRCEKRITGEENLPFTDKECADQNLPFTEFCPRCVKIWSEASAINEQTPEQAVESVKKFKENEDASESA